jgi:hypothetical protein
MPSSLSRRERSGDDAFAGPEFEKSSVIARLFDAAEVQESASGAKPRKN